MILIVFLAGTAFGIGLTLTAFVLYLYWITRRFFKH